jgi:hypothetical protein
MNLYLDDDSADALLLRLLLGEGHDVQIPSQAGLAGEEDPTHLMHAIRTSRVLLTHNYDDFKLLHELVILVRGHHPGLLIVRKDNDLSRDLRRVESFARLPTWSPVACRCQTNFIF